MLQVCSRFAFGFASAQKYLVKQSKYLIEAPPTRPASSFALYYSECIKGSKGFNVAQEMKKIRQNWKTLSDQKKKQYADISKAALPEYLKKKEEYVKKYVIPFKSVSSQNLLFASFYQNKQVKVPQNAKVQDYAKSVTELLKQTTPQQIEKFKEEAKKIKAERELLAKQFEFPHRKFNSQGGYSRHHPGQYTQAKKPAYEIYVKQWETDVEEWLKKKNIPLDIKEFKRLYNKDRKSRLAKKEEEDDE